MHAPTLPTYLQLIARLRKASSPAHLQQARVESPETGPDIEAFRFTQEALPNGGVF